jgi:hypothetical protein
MPARMSGRAVVKLLVAALLALPVSARAQGSDRPLGTSLGPHVSFGGDVAVIAGPQDDDAFFNYTDYRRNALRQLRVRIFGEWRMGGRLSLVGEIKSEDARAVDAAAVYLRWQPLAGRDFYVQAGRIPPVTGAFARRAYGRDNAVLGLPLAYQYLTSLRPDALPLTTADLLRMRGRGWQPSYPLGETATAPGIPLSSVAKWDTGVEAAWRHDRVELSAALTRGSPSVPVVRETNGGLTWSSRAALSWPFGLTAGVSAARGRWLDDAAVDLLPEGRSRPGSQSLIGVDAEFGRSGWLVRTEWMRTVFEIPIVLDADPAVRLSAWAAFAEGRYRLHPRWQVGGRIERLTFGRVRDINGVMRQWDGPVDRVEGTVGFRASRHIELRGGWQYNWRDAGRVAERGYPTCGLLYWF